MANQQLTLIIITWATAFATLYLSKVKAIRIIGCFAIMITSLLTAQIENSIIAFAFFGVNAIIAVFQLGDELWGWTK